MGNINKVCLHARANSRDQQWVKLVWKWAPRPDLRNFAPMRGRMSKKKGAYPHKLSKDQLKALIKVYCLIPSADWPSVLGKPPNDNSGSSNKNLEAKKYFELQEKYVFVISFQYFFVSRWWVLVW